MLLLALAFVLAAWGQAPACGPAAVGALTEATARVAAFDVPGAAAGFEQAAEAGCADARLPALYLRGLVDARAVAESAGDEAACAAVLVAIDALSRLSGGQPGPAEIARLVLTAALASAEGERGAMDLFLRQAIDMAALQHAAGLPGAPSLSAFEAAGDLWLDAGAAGEARAAYERAAAAVGRTPRVVAGLARSAMRLGDAPAACREIRGLLTWWGDRAGPPPAVVEARAWLRDPGCG